MDRLNSTKLTQQAIEHYFQGVYSPKTHLLQDCVLLHSEKMPVAGGGEFPLNNANTKRLVGVSDFQGEQIPMDASGIIRAVVIRFGDVAAVEGQAAPSPATINYLETRAAMPPWLLQSELVLKSASQEMFRIRVADFVPSAAPDKIPGDWAKELQKVVKIDGGQAMTLYLNTPEGASDPSASKHEYVQVNLIGAKFSLRAKA